MRQNEYLLFTTHRPKNVSGRTKAQIVKDFETKHADYFVAEAHTETCRCQSCWDKFQLRWASEVTSGNN